MGLRFIDRNASKAIDFLLVLGRKISTFQFIRRPEEA
jgi:hypothetical protein